MRAREIPLAEYMNPAHQWAQYRSTATRATARWLADRLASEAEFAIVDRGTYWTIARRFILCHLYERP